MSEKPERTCISCKRKGSKGELIRLVNSQAGIVIDYTEKLPGRGAYVCGEKACIEKGLKEGALSRAFREKAQPPSPDEFYRQLRERVVRKINSLLGMARK